MVGSLQDVSGFDAGARPLLARQTANAVAVLTAGALSLSLMIAIAILSLDLLRVPAAHSL
jgi:hypothetical protein